MSEEDRRDYRSLGEILSDAREGRGWSVEDVSERTKIAPRQIHALEGDDLAGLNGPVYARGFLRSLCQLYGLDREWMMTKLEAQLESVGESIPVTPVLPPSPSLAPVADATAEAESAPTTEATWTIETVDNARVRRFRASSSLRVPKRLWWALVAVAVVLLFWMGRTFLPQSESTKAPTLGESSMSLDTQAESVSPLSTDTLAADEASPEVEEVAGETATTTVKKVVAASGTRFEDQERVPYDEKASPGIPSVLRPADAELKLMKLSLRALDVVSARVSADGKAKKTRTLREGEVWVVEGYDHFAVEFSDVGAVIVELDGVRREAPRGLRSEWLIYPN